jgi:ketosteroid isomerase-like protein
MQIGRAITVGSYEDREEIKDLYSRYAEAADSGDGKAWADTFTADGWMFSPSHPSGRVTGRDALAAMCSGNSAFLAQQGIVKQRHINANFRISVEADRAWGMCNILYYWLHKDGVTELVGIGGYRDHLRKLEGQWYFESREGSFDKEAPSLPGVDFR